MLRHCQKSVGLLVQRVQCFRSSMSNKAAIEIFIDEQPVKVDNSYTVFQACHEAGVVIPRFCYHERLAVAGNCRMCLVEIEKSPKPVASCAAQVMPGMRVKTKSEKTRIARGGVVEFLLANHPLDCPICDQGGECDLQDITQVYGYGEGRYREYKRAVEDKQLGPLVKTSMNRCIHCTRCIRLATEVAGIHDLGKTGRGRAAEIGTYVDKMLGHEMSGNLVDVCPVGALTSGPYAFTSRPWELTSTESVDLLDGVGSAIQVDTRGPEVMRVLPRVHEEINEEWLGDKSRHAFDGLKKQRLTVPMVKGQEGYQETDWQTAFALIADRLSTLDGQDMAAVIGEFADVESITALRDLMHRLDCDSFEVRGNSTKLSPDLRAGYLMNSSIQGLDEADTLLLLGCNPRYEAPVVNSRILKNTKKGLKVGVVGTAHDLNYPYSHLGTTASTLDSLLDGSHPFCPSLSSATLPMVMVGTTLLERPDGPAILAKLSRLAQKYPQLLSQENGWNGLNILHQEASRVGALDIGISSVPRTSPAKAVLLLGCDNISPQDISPEAFVVYIGAQGDEGAYLADVVLPAAAFTEKNGTYVNTEGRTQLNRNASTPPGQAREDWMVLRALSEELGVTLPYDTLEELRFRVAQLAPHLMKYDYIEPTLFSQLALQQMGQEGEVAATPLNDNIDNYYMTNSVSRNSETMAKCSAAFNHLKSSNFKKINHI